MRRGLAVILLALLSTGAVFVGEERGNRLFRAGKYAEAVAEYRAALADGDDSPVLRYNLGTALLRLGRYGEAEEHLQAALEAVEPETRQWVYYNLGQRYLEEARASQDPRAKTGLYDAAVESYRQALRLRPDDQDAKWNYELALREREEAARQGGDGDESQEGDPREGDRGEGGGGDPREPEGGPGEQPPRPGMDGNPLAPLTPEQAERILSGVEQDERELFRDRLRQGGRPAHTTRDW